MRRFRFFEAFPFFKKVLKLYLVEAFPLMFKGVSIAPCPILAAAAETADLLRRLILTNEFTVDRAVALPTMLPSSNIQREAELVS